MILSSFGCWFGGEKDAFGPESVMPADMTFVLAVDHSDKDQIKFSSDIFEKIPSLDFFDEFLKDFEYKELLEGEWKIAVGVKLSDDFEQLKTFAEDFDFLESGSEIYIAGKFGTPERMQIFLEEMVLENPEKIEFVGTESELLWKVKKDDFDAVIARKDDIYFVAFSSEQRAEILKRLEDGGGFEADADYRDGLGYFYLNALPIVNLLTQAQTIEEEIFDVESLMAIEKFWVNFSANENGLNFSSKTYFGKDKNLVEKYYPDYKSELIGKVPSGGVISYNEKPNFWLYFQPLAEATSDVLFAFSAGNSLDEGDEYDDLFEEEELAPAPAPVKISRGVVVEDKEVEVAEEDVAVAEEDVAVAMGADMLLSQLGAIAGLDAEKVRAVFENPFAFSISDSGSFPPAIAFYINLDKNSLESAKSLVGGISVYADEVINELNAELKKENLDGIIKKEIKLVNGAALQKIYVDIASLPSEKKSGFDMMAGFDISTAKIEIYYGVLSDGVFVFALYPDFPDIYGKNPISSADYYIEMQKNARNFYSGGVSFFRMDPLLKMIEPYFNSLKSAGILPNSEEISLEYELYTKFASTFEYIFTSDVKDSDGLKSETSIKIRKAELSPELLQKRELLKIEKKAAQEAMEKLYEESVGF